MFDLSSLTEEEKKELEEYSVCLERTLEMYKNSIEEYENEYGKIPQEYKIVFASTIGMNYLRRRRRIESLHTPYHYSEYHPLSLMDILSSSIDFNNLHSYYSCFTPEMNREEINKFINEIKNKKEDNEYKKELAKGLDIKTEIYLIGMYELLLASIGKEYLNVNYEISGSKALNILKKSFQKDVINDEDDLLQPFIKSKVNKMSSNKK